MAKDVYYFSHDVNARHDPKILAMRSVYGAEGYGWFWMLVEMMREADGYKLDMQGKYIWHAYAKQMECKCMEDAQEFITDCINEFELFNSDDQYFWSNSLLTRMNKKEKVTEARQAAANKRWGKTEVNQAVSDTKDAKDMQNNSKSDAIASKNDALKESKRKEIKVKEIKTYNENTVALTNHLIDLLKINNPNVKVPRNLEKWNDEMDKLERIDNYDFMQIRSVIDFSQNDSFWKGIILSAPKLREKIGTLMMQMQRPKGNQSSNGKVSSFERLQQLAREEDDRAASGNY